MHRVWCCGFLAMLVGTACVAETVADRALGALQKNPPIAPEVFDFVVTADSRSLAVDKQSETFQRFVPEMNVLRPAFVMDVGDLILGGSAELVPAQWDEFERVTAAIQVPLVPVTGNHDISDAATEKIWKDRVGPLNFSFMYGNSLFIALNSEEVGAVNRISDEQVAWLSGELEKSKARHIFVFLHKPYFAMDWDSNWANVAEALKGFPVRVVFGGDNHLYRYIGKKEGIDYVISAGGGAELRVPEEEGGFHHYCIVRVRGDDVSWVVVKPGAILPADVVTQDRIDEVREARNVLVTTEPIEVRAGETFDRDVTVTVNNPYDAGFDSDMTWEVPAGWTVTPPTLAYSVGVQGQTDLRFRVAAASPDAVRFPVPTLNTPYKSVTFGPPVDVKKRIDLIPVYGVAKAKKAVTVDGKLDDWSGAKPMPLNYGWAYDVAATDDLQATVRVMWDDKTLYLAGEVMDDEFHQPYGGDIVWSADGLQVFMQGPWEWGLTQTKNGPEVFLYKGVGVEGETVNTEVKLAITQEGGKTTYEAAFPKGYWPVEKLAVGQTISFSICANDLDPSKPERARHWAELTPGVGDAVPGSPMAKLVLEE